MGIVYSDYYKNGKYSRTRVKVEYSGTFATASLLYTHKNGAMVADSSVTFVFGGRSTTGRVSASGGEEQVILKTSFPITKQGGTFSGSAKGTYRSDFNFEGSVFIPSQLPTETLVATNEQWGEIAEKVKGLGDEPYTDSEWKALWGEKLYDPAHPTLTGVREALLAEDLEAFPVGTEVPDTFEGVNAPWIVVNLKKGEATLQRKYVSNYGVKYHHDNTDTILHFTSSDIATFLKDIYPAHCSEECLAIISDYYTVTTGPNAGRKFMLPSASQCNARKASGTSATAVLAYYADQADTAVEGSANCEKRQKTDVEGNPKAWWTENTTKSSNGMRAGGFRPDGTYYASLVTSPSRCICPIAKIRV